jgi:DNA mismatch repair ATPase MutS
VPNDVVIEGRGHALLVTGSNMSGKSTLMRSMGVAVVMALAGAPVLASRFRVSHLTVRTSMRVKDSLASGVSHFYAELLALRRVVEAADRGEPVFFLLDEILHGTNSRERHLGAKGVILHLLDKGALGAVSTHDLGLADLVDEAGSRVRPVHLVEQTENGKMTFDHKLRDGFLTSGNALRLMRDMGLPVPADTP